MIQRLDALALDHRFVSWTVAWGVVALVGLGLVAAIIPNPLFGRQIPPEPFAIAVWLATAPLMGVLGATYTAPATSPGAVLPHPLATSNPPFERPATTLGAIGSIGAFLAIGCPVCNKIALILLGTSGALTVYAPLQPAIGAASIVLLFGTVAWRVRLRTRGGSCPV